MDGAAVPIARQLADLASSLTFNCLPGEVVRESRRRLLDALGCMLAGARGEGVEKIREAVLENGDGGRSTVIGAGRRTSMDRASLINCSALRQLDYMDGHPGPYPGHACFNIPPVLAAAELAGASGAAVVLAMVLAYEVNIRLQLGAGDPDISAYGWGAGSNLGISSAVGMGKVLGLSPEQLTHAIAIAATHAPALDAPSRDQLPESKTCVDGMVASASAIATLMARAGLTGPERVFEGEGGYKQAVARRLDTDILLAPMDAFRIMDVYTKRYNAVKCAQTAVPAALELAASLPGGWRDMEHIKVGFPERDYEQQRKDEAARRRPRGRDTANHSAVYCVAAALVDGDLGPAQFEPGRLDDSDILSLIDRIELEPRPELNQYWPAANPAQVSVTTRTGQSLSKLVVYSPGHAKNPLTDEQLEAKFRGLAAGALDSRASDAVIELAGRVEKLESIRPLMELVGAAGPH